MGQNYIPCTQINFQDWYRFGETGPQVGDFDGDGVPDFLFFHEHTGVWMVKGGEGQPDRIETFTNGLGASSSVEYGVLTDSEVYGQGVIPAAYRYYPYLNSTPPLNVVKAVKADNGIGGQNRSTHYYEGARAHFLGLGFLGFAKQVVTDETSGLVVETEKLQEFPLVGRPWRITKKVKGNMTSRVVNTFAARLLNGEVRTDYTVGHSAWLANFQKAYADQMPGSRRWFTWTAESTESSYEYNDYRTVGSQLAPIQESVTSQAGYDDYGNPATVTVTVGEGGASGTRYTKTTSSSYTNDTAHWWLGRLNCARVESKVVDAQGQIQAQTRTSAFTYLSSNGLLEKEIVEPQAGTVPTCASLDSSGDSSLELVSTYDYDRYGNRNSVATTGYNPVTGQTESRSSSSDFITGATIAGRFAMQASNALNYTEKRSYRDADGVVLSVTDPNELTVTSTYDDFGRELTVLSPAGHLTTTRHDFCDGTATGVVSAASAVPSSVCPQGMTRDGGKQEAAVFLTTKVTTVGGAQIAPPATEYFDRLGRKVQTRSITLGNQNNPDGLVVLSNMLFDAQGRTVATTQPYFAGQAALTDRNVYDDVGRVMQVLGADGSEAKTTYAGLTTTVSLKVDDKTNRVTTEHKNAQGKVDRVTRTIGGQFPEVSFRYDAQGNQIEVWTNTQGDTVGTNRRLARIDYDLRGRKIGMEEPNQGRWTYRYNAFGELVEQVSPNQRKVGSSTRLTYDVLGRLTARAEGSLNSSWTYDQTGKAGGGVWRGKLSSTSAGNQHRRTYSYDPLGRPIEVATQIGEAQLNQTTGYDGFGRVATVSYPSGVVLTRSYDAKTGIYKQLHYSLPGQSPAKVWELGALNANGTLAGEIYGNNTYTLYTYQRGSARIQRIEGATGSGSATKVLLDWNYQYNLAGQLVVTNDTGAAYSQDYDYDLGGNLKKKAGLANYGYDPVRLHAVTAVDKNGSRYGTYTYDDNGNQLTAQVTGQPNRNISWTSFDMPELISRGSASHRFHYDADHSRAKMENGDGSITYYLNPRLDLGGHYERQDRPNQPIRHRHTLYGSHGAIGELVLDVASQSQQSAKVRYYHRNPLGSFSLVTNDSGTITETQRFDPFGSRIDDNGNPDTASKESDHGFTGHEMLDDVGLIHMNGRLFDAELGRFVSPDPIVESPLDLQSYNRYSYVMNDPMNRIDPSGYASWWVSNGRAAVKAVVAVIASIYVGNALSSWLAEAAAANGSTAFAAIADAGDLSMITLTPAGGFVSGAAGGFVGGAINGGTLESALQGAFSGGLDGGMMAGIHSIPYLNGSAERTIAHAAIGGISSLASGGKFGPGAIAAGFAHFAGAQADFHNKGANALARALIGGAASRIAGGKFLSAAITSAFGYLYNESAEESRLRRLELELAPGRILTDNEKTAALSVHPDLDASIVTIKFDQMNGDGAYTPGNTIHFPPKYASCEDFVTCEHGKLTGWFIHEITHSWQAQHGRSPTLGHIFSRDIISFGEYLSFRQYRETSSPKKLSTEKEADWYMWHYLCRSNRITGC